MEDYDDDDDDDEMLSVSCLNRFILETLRCFLAADTAYIANSTGSILCLSVIRQLFRLVDFQLEFG